jgi:nucleotide-binding universal stress UspA family protein
MLRDLLVHVDGSENGRGRVKLAVDLAVRAGARLSGLHVTPPAEIPPNYKPSQVEGAMGLASERLQSDARTAAEIFQEEAVERLSDPPWLVATGDVAHLIATRSRYVDLVILGQYEWQGSPEHHPFPIAHAVVLRCACPVLVVPGGAPIGPFARVGVAWDGSREAARAVHDALPLLRMARTVELVTMLHPAAKGDVIDVDRLISHLGNHKVKAEAKVTEVRDVDEHKSLQREIGNGKYDLLVMGGYSHPTWMEFIFGGVTDSTLLVSKIPVLVSH